MTNQLQWFAITCAEARDLVQQGALVWFRPDNEIDYKDPDTDIAYVRREVIDAN